MGAWTWHWMSQPAPQQFGDNPFWDWVRVLCLIASVVMLFATARVLIEAARRETPMPLSQVARFVGAALLVVSVALTELSVMGTAASPRVVVNVLGVVLLGFGLRGIRRKQRHQRIVCDRVFPRKARRADPDGRQK